MGLTFNGIDRGQVAAVDVLTVTPVVDQRTGELLWQRLRLDVTVLPPETAPEGEG